MNTLTSIQSPTTSSPDILITRLFNAPRQLVFQAWSEPALLAKWFAPNDCIINIYALDFREGGSFHQSIQPPVGQECSVKGEYLEIVEPERIVYRVYLVDEAGQPVESLASGKDEDWPSETIVTVTFEEQNGQTKLTLHQNAPEAVAKRTGAYPSWLQMLDKLADALSKA